LSYHHFMGLMAEREMLVESFVSVLASSGYRC
jgi:hypothetical protein